MIRASTCSARRPTLHGAVSCLNAQCSATDDAQRAVRPSDRLSAPLVHIIAKNRPERMLERIVAAAEAGPMSFATAHRGLSRHRAGRMTSPAATWREDQGDRDIKEAAFSVRCDAGFSAGPHGCRPLFPSLMLGQAAVSRALRLQDHGEVCSRQSNQRLADRHVAGRCALWKKTCPGRRATLGLKSTRMHAAQGTIESTAIGRKAEARLCHRSA
jgi:hypothetical protein